jgi:hypothetical protein
MPGRTSRAAALELTASLPGLATTSTRLTRLKVSIADWTPFWHQYFSPLFYQHEAELFASSGGGKWKPLSARYATWKVRHFPGRGMLVATGALKTSLTRPFAAGAVYRASAQGLLIGSSLPYARAHFTGTPPDSRGPRSLPKRREVWIPWQFLAGTAPVLKKWIRDNAAKEPIPGLEVPPA